jgi:hypothetical protein
MNQPASGLGYFIHSPIESRFVRAGGTVGAAQLADELQSGGLYLLIRRRRLEIREGLDISAHVPILR